MNLNFLKNFNLLFYFSFLFLSCEKNKNNNLDAPSSEDTQDNEEDSQDNIKNDPIVFYFPGIGEKVDDKNKFSVKSETGNFDVRKLIKESNEYEDSMISVFSRNGIDPNNTKKDNSKEKSIEDQAKDIFDKNKDDFKKKFEQAKEENRNILFEGYSQGGLVLIELLNQMNKDPELKKVIEELNSRGLLKVITIASPINGYQGGQITQENILSLKQELENLENLLFEKLKDKDFCGEGKGKVLNNDKNFKEKLRLTEGFYSIKSIFYECFILNPLTYTNIEVFKSILNLMLTKEDISVMSEKELLPEFEKAKINNKSSFSLLASVCQKRNQEFEKIGIDGKKILSIRTDIPASLLIKEIMKESILDKNTGIKVEENELNKIFEDEVIKKSLEELQKIHGLLLEGKEDSKNDWMVPFGAQNIKGSEIFDVENQYHLGAMNNSEILKKIREFSRA